MTASFEKRVRRVEWSEESGGPVSEVAGEMVL